MENNNGIIDVRVLSPRELEQLELQRQKLQEAVDKADEFYSTICTGAAVMHDCYEALKKNEFTDDQALRLTASLAKMVWEK